MRAVLLAVLDGMGFTWRLGTALVRAAIAGVVGMLAGLVVFALLGLLFLKEWGSVVWNGGTMLSGAPAALFAFLDSFRRSVPPDVMGSAAWASAREVATDLAAPKLARDPAALLVGRAADRRGEPLRYAGPAHLLTVAPTRSGKGVGTVLPIPQFIDPARGSVAARAASGQGARPAPPAAGLGCHPRRLRRLPAAHPPAA